MWKQLFIQYGIWVVLCWFMLSFQAINREGQTLQDILHRWFWEPVSHYAERIDKMWASLETRQRARQELIRENQRLREQLAYYQHLSILYRHLLKEVETTQKVLNRSWSKTFRVIQARVLVHRASPVITHEIIIDRGRDHGIHRFDPVVGSSGMIGFVFSSGRQTSLVRLITHPFFSAGAEVDETDYQGMIRGSGQRNLMLLRYLPHGIDLTPGSLVMTSGLEGIFPAHLPLGRIAGSKTSPEGDVIYEVEVLESLEKLHWVTVLLTSGAS